MSTQTEVVYPPAVPETVTITQGIPRDWMTGQDVYVNGGVAPVVKVRPVVQVCG